MYQLHTRNLNILYAANMYRKKGGGIGGRRREGKERKKAEKRNKMCYVHVPTSYKEYKHYAPHTCTNKRK